MKKLKLREKNEVFSFDSQAIQEVTDQIMEAYSTGVVDHFDQGREIEVVEKDLG
ncbi:hypothetical protein J2S13_001395 [Oikeobacillus pervagus]|uniref:Uncharacterized protein n=1 Tax=Oikeobacillus pervagus TaxID=1325931 RepID=A0AAJ1WKD0_9BACI|nr:hypothetical protein [Oikeobacillus pervagus]MDQ0214996.1 hypothetical protein [Oikeobacillus pervagus]